MNENLSSPLKILAFFAHPDDESVFLGGTFAYLADQGAEIHFLCATRGEGGEMGDPPICARENLGSIREKELMCAVNGLGGKTVKFLDYQDPVVGPEGELYSFTENIIGLAEKLQDEIYRVKPHIVITHGPGGEYGHPAHIHSHEAMMTALSQEFNFSPVVYAPSWLSRETGEFTPEPSFVVDITPWKNKKIQAISCHKSQHGMFLRHGATRAGRPVTIPEIIRPLEALCRILPVEPFENQTDPLGAILEKISQAV
ncbi:MAG: PIG-L family deacetylase [Anaerolineales bacterium]|nr:PIG-L family deacetylase [Anaerolineales bacterium]